MSLTKKAYTSPELVCHGDVDEITNASGAGFADVPFGNRGRNRGRSQGKKGRGNGPPAGKKPWFPSS